MKNKIHSNGVDVELIKSTILIEKRNEDGFYEFDTREHAERAWKEIKEGWKRNNYRHRLGIVNYIDRIIKPKYESFLLSWP